jgi:hypothetical protein
MAEALAARDGMKLALENGGGRVCLELDNTTVASLLQSSDGNRSIIAAVWHDIRELSSSFVNFRVSVVRREGKEVAHACAKMASIHSDRSHSWSGYMP